MELFSAEKIAEVVPRTLIGQCRSCGRKLELVRTVVDCETGNSVRMFRCQCGDRTWTD